MTATTEHYGLNVGDTVFRITSNRWGNGINAVTRYTVTKFTATQAVLVDDRGADLRIRLGGPSLDRARVIGNDNWSSGLVTADDPALAQARTELKIQAARSRAHAAVDAWIQNRSDPDAARAAASTLLAFADEADR